MPSNNASFYCHCDVCANRLTENRFYTLQTIKNHRRNNTFNGIPYESWAETEGNDISDIYFIPCIVT